MISAVLDSNVLLSAVVSSQHSSSPPGQLVRMWRAGDFELVCSPAIVQEVERALEKPYFRRRLSEDDVRRVVRLIRRNSRMVDPTVVVSGVATHPEDDVVLSTAVTAGANVLVTGD